MILLLILLKITTLSSVNSDKPKVVWLNNPVTDVKFPGNVKAPPTCHTMDLPCRFPFWVGSDRFDRCTTYNHKRDTWCSLQDDGSTTFYGICQEQCKNIYRNCSIVKEECEFPYKYQGNHYGTCSTHVFKRHSSYDWCATRVNHNTEYVSDHYGMCSEDCPRDCQTTNERCIFPFEYQGKTYDTCTEDHTSPLSSLRSQWCSGATHANGSHIFGQHVLCKPGPCQVTKNGKSTCAPKVEPCKFPAFYRGRIHYQCLYDPGEDLYPWCPTKLDQYGRYTLFSGHFGWCGSSCSLKKKHVGILLQGTQTLTASASSHYENLPEYRPELAVDGIVSKDSIGFYSSGEPKLYEWLQIDMAKSTQVVMAVIIENRRDCCQERRANIEIRVANTPAPLDYPPKPFTHGEICSLVEKASTSEEANSLLTVIIHCRQLLKGRFVILQTTSLGTLDINEVEVFVQYGVVREAADYNYNIHPRKQGQRWLPGSSKDKQGGKGDSDVIIASSARGDRGKGSGKMNNGRERNFRLNGIRKGNYAFGIKNVNLNQINGI